MIDSRVRMKSSSGCKKSNQQSKTQIEKNSPKQILLGTIAETLQLLQNLLSAHIQTQHRHKQHQQMADMMKKVGKLGKKGLMRHGIGGLMPPKFR